MSAEKVTKAANLKRRLNRACDNSFEAFSSLFVQRDQHRVCGFANRNDENAAIGVQVVKIFTNPQHLAFAGDMLRKSPADAGFAQRMLEDVAGNFLHLGL